MIYKGNLILTILFEYFNSSPYYKSYGRYFVFVYNLNLKYFCEFLLSFFNGIILYFFKITPFVQNFYNIKLINKNKVKVTGIVYFYLFI